MSPSRPFILRPVATSLLMAAILLVGIVAYRFLPHLGPARGRLPDHPGADLLSRRQPGGDDLVGHRAARGAVRPDAGPEPDVLDQFGRRLGDHPAVRLDLSLDIAEQEVQAAINAAGNLLPSDLPAPPIYAKVNPADAPILTLALTSKTLPLTQVEDMADTRLAQKISQLPGVGLVSISGGQRPAVRVQVNPRALAAYGLNIDDLRTTLGNANVNTPKGNFDGPTRAYTINANDQISNADDYLQPGRSPIKNGAPVRLTRRRHRRQRRREHQARRLDRTRRRR